MARNDLLQDLTRSMRGMLRQAKLISMPRSTRTPSLNANLKIANLNWHMQFDSQLDVHLKPGIEMSSWSFCKPCIILLISTSKSLLSFSTHCQLLLDEDYLELARMLRLPSFSLQRWVSKLKLQIIHENRQRSEMPKTMYPTLVILNLSRIYNRKLEDYIRQNFDRNLSLSKSATNLLH